MDFGTYGSMKEVWDKYRKVYVRIIDQLVVDPSFLAYFVQDEIFNRAIEDSILTKVRGVSRADGARELIQVLKSRGERGLNTFYEALTATKQYELAELVFPEKITPERPVQATSPTPTPVQTGASQPRVTEVRNPVTPMLQDLHISRRTGAGDRPNTATDTRPPVSVFVAGETSPASQPQIVAGSSHNPTSASPSLSSHNTASSSNSGRLTRLTGPEESHDGADTSDSESDMSDGEALKDDSTEEITYQLKLTARAKIKRKFRSKNVYRMSQPRGRVCIINNEEFDQAVNKDQVDLDYREGTDVDQENLSTVFRDLGFIVNAKNNLSSARMLDLISKETELEEHKNYNMFVLVILSHGQNDIVYGADGRKVHAEDIYRRLSPENFPHMKGKPKWIIMQACSGSKKDHYGVKTDTLPSASQEMLPPLYRVVAKSASQPPSTSTSDILILKSSFPGYVSLRDTKLGSYMVRALVEVLHKHSCHRHVEELIKEVRRRVAIKSSEPGNSQGSQTVTHTTTLYRNLYLFPGFNPQ